MMERWTSQDQGWADYCEAGGEMTESAYLECIEQVDDPDICRKLLISDTWLEDKHPMIPMFERPRERDLARLSADYQPSAGADGPRIMLGEVTDYLYRTHPEHRTVLLHALAAYLFVAPSYKGKPLYRYWLRNKPTVPYEVKESVARLSRVPIGLWGVVSCHSDGVELEDLVGFGQYCKPTGLVQFPALKLRPGQAILARVAPCGEQWVGMHPMVLPCAPPADLIRAKVTRIIKWTRVHYRAATIKDVLRWRGDVFHRWCVEWALGEQKGLPYSGTLNG